MLPQPMSSPFDKLAQCGVHFLCIASIVGKRVLIANGFRFFMKIKMGRVQPVRLAMERLSPLPKQLVQSLVAPTRRVPQPSSPLRS